jgi:predicted nucleotidyltransferase
MLRNILSVPPQELALPEMHPGLSLNEHYMDSIKSVMDSVSFSAPEVVGMTIFGSLSRSEATVKSDGSVSDIDGVVVIDVDNDDELVEFTSSQEWQNTYSKLGSTTIGMATKVKIQDLVDETAGTNFESELDLLLISERILVDTPNKLLAAAPEPDSIVSDWSNIDKVAMDAIKYFIGRDQTAGLFFPIAYGDLLLYRSMSLQTLAEHRLAKPQITSRIWDNIRVYTNHFRKGRENDNFVATDLPENLDEALQEYRVI